MIKQLTLKIDIDFFYAVPSPMTHRQVMLYRSVYVGNLILIKDDLTKSVNYPMGIISNVTLNSFREVTGTIIKKSHGSKVK